YDDGIYDAWNKGISAASGDLIGLLNSGDEYHPDVVADVVEAAAAMANATGTVLCGYTLLVRDGKIVKRYPNGLYRTLLFGIGAVHPAMFVGRDVYRRVGLYEKISIAS